ERVEKFTFSLSGTLLTFWNRRMRTRMYGGVRGRGLAAPSYSIPKPKTTNYRVPAVSDLDQSGREDWRIPAGFPARFQQDFQQDVRSHLPQYLKAPFQFVSVRILRVNSILHRAQLPARGGTVQVSPHADIGEISAVGMPGILPRCSADAIS
ncbi:hypothetical protein, partial [Paenibacillus antibioticophila]|uniref:hypothetical protein n=1 Tax=Paenibacillus antibioticophila TaxID=1274374 RepID=UPI001BB3C3F2